MKSIAPLILISLLAAALPLQAQEPVSRAEAVKIATVVNFNLEQLADTPIPTDGDVKRPFAMRAERRGIMVIPEAKLSAETLARLGKEPSPVGQLCLAGVAPARNGEAISRDQLKLVTVEYEGRDFTFPFCVLGARKGADGKPELLIYGKAKQPVVTVPLKAQEQTRKWPLEFEAVREGGQARVTLFLLGKYQATFEVTDFSE